MMRLDSLTPRVRELMLEELELDISSGAPWSRPRLSERGAHDYPELLRQALRWHDPSWLAEQLRQYGRMEDVEYRLVPRKGYIPVDVPITAADTLAEGEFNRFYSRGVCRAAIEHNVPGVEVYRAKEVEEPRPESERIIGTTLNPHELLTDLRKNPPLDKDPRLGVPGGPNSGISVRLPRH